MSTQLSQQSSANPFPPLTPPLSVTDTDFDRSVEAEMHAIAAQRCAPREDQELLAACTRAVRDEPHVPKSPVVVSVSDGTVVLDGHASFYYERAAAECAVRFVDGVRCVENHIVVEPTP